MSDEQQTLFDLKSPKKAPRPEQEPLTSSAGSPAFRVDPRLGVFGYVEALGDHLLLAGLSRGRIRLAHDLVALEAGLTAEQSRSLFMAVIIGLEAQSQGSTFVPLPSRGDYFERRLGWLLPEALITKDPRWAPQGLVSAFEEVLEKKDLQILGHGEQWKPLIVDEGRLYHQRMRLYESRLVQAVASRLKKAKKKRDEAQLASALGQLRENPAVIKGSEIRLNAEQEYAVLAALHLPLTLITGGPGTGKTSIVVSILRMLMRLGVAPTSISLAAPTGKAANRMAESIYGQLRSLKGGDALDEGLAENLGEPRTLHRLLGYSPGRDSFHHHRGNPLTKEMVIVDEASMIDLFMMERLLRAVSPGAHLVLLGDADQLPSVDTGAVLRDLIPDIVSTDEAWRSLVDGPLPASSGDGPTAEHAVRLTQSYRMRADDPAGREILVFARGINDLEKGQELVRPEETDIETAGLEQGVRIWSPETMGSDEESALNPFVNWWFETAILGGEATLWQRRFNATYEVGEAGMLTEDSTERLHQVLRHYRRARVLTLTRVFSTGSTWLNERFHRAMAHLGRGRVSADFRFHPGEPVMMLRNDYDRNLFNGDQGVVVWCRDKAGGDVDEVSLMAVFERSGRLVAYPLGELRKDLEHAFAMTVHKSQGSEFEYVALVLPKERMTLLNKELLYTGVTRASRGVLIAGDHKLLEMGAGNRSRRFSAVAEKLRVATAEESGRNTST